MNAIAVRKTHSMLFKQFGRDLPSSRAATPMLTLRNLLPLNVVDNLPHNIREWDFLLTSEKLKFYKQKTGPSGNQKII